MEHKIVQAPQDRKEASTLTGVPMQARLSAEQNSGLSLHDVRVRYRSDKPDQIQAPADAQGTSRLEHVPEQGHFPLRLGSAEQSGVIQSFKVQNTIWDTNGPCYSKSKWVRQFSPLTYERVIQILEGEADQTEGPADHLNADIRFITEKFSPPTAAASTPGSANLSEPAVPQEQSPPDFTVLNVTGGQPGVKILEDIWDTEWAPDVKIRHIQEHSPETFVTIIKSLILEIGRVKKDLLLTVAEKREQNDKLREELIFMVDQYNRLLPSGEMDSRPHVTLPQAKTVTGAPSGLVMGQTSPGGDTARGINIDIYLDACRQLNTHGSAISALSHSAVYIEDPIEILRNGYISTRIAYPLDAGNAIIAGRHARGLSSADISDDEVGAKSAEGNDGVRIAKDVCASLLQSDDLRHVYRLCPIEGGNMLTGSDFIIVGKDSLYATMELFDADEAKAKEMIAKDFDLVPERVFPVEQPGAYHLDLCMLLINDQTVLLKAKDPRHKSLERTEKDLTSQGFTVIFEDGCAIGPGFNFINGEFLNIGDDVIFLTNAPNVAANEELSRAKDRFIALLRSYGVKDVYFIKDSLDGRGTAGFGCRAKGIPDALIRRQSDS